MAAKNIQTRHINADKETIMQKFTLALPASGANIKYHDIPSGTIMAETQMSLWSWGEEIRINVDGSGNVTIKSECKLATQIIDWGRNKKMVNKIFSNLLLFLSSPK